jgi:hypothetical protein
VAAMYRLVLQTHCTTTVQRHYRITCQKVPPAGKTFMHIVCNSKETAFCVKERVPEDLALLKIPYKLPPDPTGAHTEYLRQEEKTEFIYVVTATLYL